MAARQANLEMRHCAANSSPQSRFCAKFAGQCHNSIAKGISFIAALSNTLKIRNTPQMIPYRTPPGPLLCRSTSCSTVVHAL